MSRAGSDRGSCVPARPFQALAVDRILRKATGRERRPECTAECPPHPTSCQGFGTLPDRARATRGDRRAAAPHVKDLGHCRIVREQQREIDALPHPMSRIWDTAGAGGTRGVCPCDASPCRMRGSFAHELSAQRKRMCDPHKGKRVCEGDGRSMVAVGRCLAACVRFARRSTEILWRVGQIQEALKKHPAGGGWATGSSLSTRTGRR